MSDCESDPELEGAGLHAAVTLDELKALPKKELKDWLSTRGQRKSGSKEVLANRIYRAIHFGDSDIGLTDSDSDENQSDLPNPFEFTNGWQDISTSNCPQMREEDVLNYFIYNKNPVTGKTKNCHRQLKKSRKLSNENFVFDILFHDLESTLYVCVKGKCRPSMKNKVSVDGGKLSGHYNSTATLVKQTGNIQAATCNCKAGVSGVCSHVGALLFTGLKIKNACTSMECRWQHPRAMEKPPSPKRLQDIRFTKTDSVKHSVAKPYPGIYQASACNDPDVFLTTILEGLKVSNPSCVLFQTLCSDSEDLSHIFRKYEPSFMYLDYVNINSYVCLSSFIQFTNSIHITPEDSQRVNKATRGQAKNKIWKRARTYVLTASNFGKICKRRDSTSPDTLLKYLRGYKEVPPNVPCLLHGRKHESIARRQYAALHQRTCMCDLHVKDMGLYICPDYPFLGASVDGLVKCSKCGTGVLEIKCPYGKSSDKWRNKTLHDCASNAAFCLHEQDGKLMLKENHDYYFQLMGQMAVLGVEWADFVTWTKKGINIQRIKFDINFWQAKLFHKLKCFYTNFFVAELHTERVRRGKSLLP